MRALYLFCTLAPLFLSTHFILRAPIFLTSQRIVFAILLMTYLLDALLFFYYKKNTHLNRDCKNNLFLVVRWMLGIWLWFGL